jgi:soluble lytic murein transglycosylase-like protein
VPEAAPPAPQPEAAPADDAAAEAAKPAAEEAPKAPDAPPPSEASLRDMVRREAAKVGMPAEVAEAVADVESGFNPKAVGGVGEIGLMQVLPSTARMLGFREPLPRLFDPETNVRYGVRYLGEAWRKTGEDICGTVMKYRAGHGETRFSHRSVAYCLRVRAKLAARGFKVTGTVPVATFGEPSSSPARAGVAALGAKRLPNGRVRMRFRWGAIDARRQALDRAAASSLTIVQ